MKGGSRVEWRYFKDDWKLGRTASTITIVSKDAPKLGLTKMEMAMVLEMAVLGWSFNQETHGLDVLQLYPLQGTGERTASSRYAILGYVFNAI